MQDDRTQFDAALAAVRSLKSGVSNQQKLQLYALKKQGEEGDAPGKKPPGMVAGAKWGAWDKLRGTEPARARQQYVAIVQENWPAAMAREEEQKEREGLANIGDGGAPTDAAAPAVDAAPAAVAHAPPPATCLQRVCRCLPVPLPARQPPEEASEPAPAQPPAPIEGLVLKRGNGFPFAWRRRRFRLSLEDARLHYFDIAKPEAPRGAFTVTAIRRNSASRLQGGRGLSPEGDTAYRNSPLGLVFEVAGHAPLLVLAPSAPEQEMWLGARLPPIWSWAPEEDPPQAEQAQPPQPARRKPARSCSGAPPPLASMSCIPKGAVTGTSPQARR